ncbi:Sigma 54 interacting domain protein [Desulfofarcimen acetoxidans DSM 771]|uniref:Sigma 54 interacting domain protein n=1 Tax=Desulfofarcimen acetoxidans (strain ATCC 49208 / DSM 771 / KCTC 5769 / VKM B-1644 / 5575) TaxID=485916 RepID=C8VXX8_DESAS|nr:AAA family ATPase [Desulfofarcimen acetoxidans]ACV64607.1 Sigma 54 interacting domain protein [Desulfofarcimen acetoxidans DSM 771]
MAKYCITKQFTMKTKITERTLAVSEAFGISLDDEFTFTIYDNLKLDISQGNIIYITGDSGSGKSILLKELRQQYPNAVATNELQIEPDTVIIDGVGQNIDQAIYYLTLVGLNDAFIFLRKYKELSDGQKYRYQLAKLLETTADAYFIDEFCALLDRETAKVVAFNMQKICRKFNKTLVVATTHNDLKDDLQPNILIRKGLEKEVALFYLPVTEPLQCSLIKNLKLQDGTLDDYKTLSRFHYRSGKVTVPQKIYKYTNGEETTGVIIYCYTYLALAGRNQFTQRYKAATSEVARLLNQEVALISRVVLHPKYRGIGLGSKLIKDTLPLTGKRYVEMLTTMGNFNPFAEKAGMTKVDYTSNDRFKKIRSQLQLLGWDMVLANSRQYNLQKLNELDEATYKLIADPIVKKVRQAKDGGVQGVNPNKKKASDRTADEYTKEEVAAMIKEILPKNRIYYIWENPEWSAS